MQSCDSHVNNLSCLYRAKNESVSMHEQRDTMSVLYKESNVGHKDMKTRKE